MVLSTQFHIFSHLTAGERVFAPPRISFVPPLPGLRGYGQAVAGPLVLVGGPWLGHWPRWDSRGWADGRREQPVTGANGPSEQAVAGPFLCLHPLVVVRRARRAKRQPFIDIKRRLRPRGLGGPEHGRVVVWWGGAHAEVPRLRASGRDDDLKRARHERARARPHGRTRRRRVRGARS